MGIALSAAAELGFEHSLRIREAQLREAMALAGLGVWEWDVALGIVTWSPELRRILGVDDGCKASVQAFMALVHADDRPWAEKAMRESLRTGFALETPFRVVRPDGSTRVLKGRATTSRFANGAPAYMVGALQDLGSAKFFPDLDRDRAALDSMSERERQVLVLVAQGGTSREIASRLRLSPKTVETYRSRLMSKLGLEGLADLVRFSIRYRVITP